MSGLSSIPLFETGTLVGKCLRITREEFMKEYFQNLSIRSTLPEGTINNNSSPGRKIRRETVYSGNGMHISTLKFPDGGWMIVEDQIQSFDLS